MITKKELDLKNAPMDFKFERYAYGDYLIDVIENDRQFEAWILHKDSFFAEACLSAPKKEMVGTRFENVIDHKRFLEMLQMVLPLRIEEFRKKYLSAQNT